MLESLKNHEYLLKGTTFLHFFFYTLYFLPTFPDNGVQRGMCGRALGAHPTAFAISGSFTIDFTGGRIGPLLFSVFGGGFMLTAWKCSGYLRLSTEDRLAFP